MPKAQSPPYQAMIHASECDGVLFSSISFWLPQKKCLIKGGGIMGIQVVTYKYYPFGIRVVLIRQPLYLQGPVVPFTRPVYSDLLHPPRGSPAMKAQHVPFLTYYGDSCRLCETGGCVTAISINHQLLHLQEEMRLNLPGSLRTSHLSRRPCRRFRMEFF